MVDIPSLAVHLAPNTIRRLEQAAERRYEEGECLKKQNRLLGALYLYGYSVEMCLAAAYFRSAGLSVNDIVGEEMRREKMKKARNQPHPVDGKPLMDNDPHPLTGWARFLQWHRESSDCLATATRKRLQEAVRKAEQVYKHWRPELRYKLTDVSIDQLNEVRFCVHWFIKQRGHL